VNIASVLSVSLWRASAWAARSASVLPGSGWISKVNQRFKTPVNALLMGAVITVLFCLLVYINPGSNYHLWFVTYPAHVNALVALVAFGVSGIYLSFLLTVIGAIIARARGWRPEARSTSGSGRGRS
jgi:amino acid transporter